MLIYRAENNQQIRRALMRAKDKPSSRRREKKRTSPRSSSFLTRSRI
jgi:hypothetical protein